MSRWSPERWATIKALFHDLTALPAAERDAALDARTTDDPEARDAVRRMLSHATRDVSRVDRGALGLLPGLRAPVTAEVPPVGARFGPFEVVREVGRGGMGIVMEAHRREGTGEARVALKLLPPTRVEAVFARRFASEQRLLRSLDHPGIARFVDSGWTPAGRPWFAMAFVDGQPLDVWCTHQAATVPRRARLVADVCDAVQHAHDRQVLHRDLKPSNILVTGDGQPVLVDFGIARTLDDDAPGTLTQAGFRPMSLSFASPEHLAGHPLTATSDAYSLGAVLYTLLAGRPPGAPPVPPGLEGRGEGATAGEPTALDRCTLTALARDPAARYPSARAFGAAIRTAVGT